MKWPRRVLRCSLSHRMPPKINLSKGGMPPRASVTPRPRWAGSAEEVVRHLHSIKSPFITCHWEGQPARQKASTPPFASREVLHRDLVKLKNSKHRVEETHSAVLTVLPTGKDQHVVAGEERSHPPTETKGFNGASASESRPSVPATSRKSRRHPPAVVDLSQPGFLRLEQVLAVYPISRAAFYAGIATGHLPKPVALGLRSVGWRVESIRALIESPPDFAKL